ncbi:MAG: PAC2 family protein [Acidimicrobiia bacterium]
MESSLRIDRTVTLRNPVIVAAFSGWNDAAQAATDTIRHLMKEYNADQIASIDAESHVDYQAHRPEVVLVDGVVREIRWPRFDVYAAQTPGARDMVLLLGVEPNYQWVKFIRSIRELAGAVGATQLITLGALLADVPHTREPQLTGSASDALMNRIGMQRSTYEGPTGIIGAIHDACHRDGFDSVSLWVPVSHYINQSPNPVAVRALVRGLGKASGVDIPEWDLDASVEQWRTQVNAVVADDDDITEYVHDLEERSDAAPLVTPVESEIPSADELGAAFEEFLREQPGT